jgi:uridine phosphorylase
MSEAMPHIRLTADQGFRYALLAGDPARLDRILPLLENGRDLEYNREFRSAAGSYKGTEVLLLSTGIGGASMGIAVEELHLIGVTHAIRIGSAGAYRPGIGIGDLLIANGAVKDDGASNTYLPAQMPAVPDTDLLFRVIRAAEENGYRHHVGVVRSHDSFYTDREDEICREWGARGVTGADMETAALFTVGAVRGVKTASILNNVVLFEGDAGEGIGEYVDGESAAAAGERAEIVTALEALHSVDAGF